MPRILGIDYGHRRMGFAISDPTGFLASAHSVFEYGDLQSVCREIKRICEEQAVEKIVIGWPVNMDGTAGPMTEAVEAFIQKIEPIVQVPIVKWDERLTSKAAEDVLIEAGTRRSKRKQVVDKMAAQIMLQGYLDAQGGV